MSPTHTAESIAALIQANYEPDNAERLLAALRPLDGTPITTRLLDKLPGGRVAWRLSRHYGWTELTNKPYRDSRGDHPEGLQVILARTESSVPLDVAYVERENTRYFEGRRMRNTRRDAALADANLRTRLAIVMNEIEDLTHRLAFARQQLAELIEQTDSPFWADRYDLERACGLRKEPK